MEGPTVINTVLSMLGPSFVPGWEYCTEKSEKDKKTTFEGGDERSPFEVMRMAVRRSRGRP